jgi:hypothetical protein
MSSPTKRIKLYIGCSLTQAPVEFRAAVDALKDQLRQDYDVLDFLGLADGSPVDVYRWDIQTCVAKCDLLVGICDYPAIGLGYEMAVAVEHYHKPTLAVAHTSTHVSRLLLGIEAPGFSFERYDNFDEISQLIARKLSEQKVKAAILSG